MNPGVPDILRNLATALEAEDFQIRKAFLAERRGDDSVGARYIARTEGEKALMYRTQLKELGWTP
jgi:hypothetical protein